MLGYLLEGISISFSYSSSAKIKALDQVSFYLQQGESLGLVGESGSGKSTLAKTWVQLLQPDSGICLFEGRNIIEFQGAELGAYQQQVQMIFQDPFSSLNPRMTTLQIIAEPLRVFATHLSANQRQQLVYAVLDRVGLPTSAINRFPHQFSGGQCQRIAIARALIGNPRVLICDEPVSALDVSIQAQIMNLLVDLKNELNMSILFISHDISLTRYISDRIMVMQQGRVVECATAESICSQPTAEYTKKLIDSVMEITIDRC